MTVGGDGDDRAMTEWPVITEPGVYDIPMEHYLALPHLSASGVKDLLPPKGCPALFIHGRENPSPPAPHHDLGTAAHTLVLGVGDPIEVFDAEDRKSSTLRAAMERSREAGRLPLLAREYETVQAMAEKLIEHVDAVNLITAANGLPEQTIIWEADGVLKKARPDWLPERRAPGQQLILTDYKTAHSVAPVDVDSAGWNWGYFIKAEWYCEGVEALGLAETTGFTFIFQMTKPPYLVEVRQYDRPSLMVARMMITDACAIFKECTESGIWPSFTNGVSDQFMTIPYWGSRDYQDRLEIS